MALSSQELNNILMRNQNPIGYTAPNQGTPKQTGDTRNLSLLQKILPVIGGIGGAVIGGAIGGPVGAVAGGAIGGGLGQGAQEITDQEQGINAGRVLKEGAFGAVGGIPLSPALKFLGLGGKTLPGVVKAGEIAGGAADDVVRRSANALLQGSDVQVANAVKFGISPQEELVRFIPKFSQRGATTLEQMVGKTAKTGRQLRRGVIDDILDEEVAFVDQFAKTTGKNVKLTGSNVIKSLEQRANERKLLLNLGEDDAEIQAIDEFISAAKKKYGRKGISLDEAVKTVREANRKFAEKISSTEKGAVRPVVQKIEADGLREALQGFPDIQRSLSDQQALLTIKPFLSNSAVKNINNKFSLSQIDITKPGSVVDMIMNNPRVAQKTVQYGSKIPGAGATPIASRTTEQALEKAAPTIKKRIFDASMRQGAARVVAGAATPQEQAQFSQAASLDSSIKELEQYNATLDEAVATSQVPEGVQLGDGSIITKGNIKQMYLQDFATTGGKNLSKIAALEKGLFAEESAKKVSAEVQKQTIGLSTAESILDSIESQLATIGLGEGFGQRVRGSVLKAQGVFGEAPEVQAFNAYREGIANVLTKSLGQVGNLSDRDVQYAISLIPKITDTSKEAQLKLQNIRGLIQSKREALQYVPQIMSSGQYPEYGSPTE